MSITSSTNNKCCHAFRKWPSQGQAYKALAKGRCVFLREIENDHGKMITQAYSRCSRKKKSMEKDEELCWKHKSVEHVIQIDDIIEENGYSLVTIDNDYFDKVKKKKKSKKKETSIITTDDQENIKKIMTSQYSNEFEQIVINFIKKY